MRSWSRRLRSLVVAVALIGAFATPWVAPTAAVASPPRPVAAASIRLAVDGSEVASFDQLLALSSVLEGPFIGGSVHRFTVVLRRPATASLEVAAWHDAALRGEDTARRDVVMTMHGTDGKPVMRYLLAQAFPSKLELATSDASEVLMETVTLTCAHIQRVAP